MDEVTEGAFGSEPVRQESDMFTNDVAERVYVARTDVDHPLSSCSKYGFELEGVEWPSVEHYYHGMKFEEGEIRDSIRATDHPTKTSKLAKANKRQIRKDWKNIRQVMMTRAVYTKCRTHAAIAELLLSTGDKEIVETSMYDYYWGCGRDGRGHNTYGKVLMAVRDRLRQEQETSE